MHYKYYITLLVKNNTIKYFILISKSSLKLTHIVLHSVDVGTPEKDNLTTIIYL